MDLLTKDHQKSRKDLIVELSSLRNRVSKLESILFNTDNEGYYKFKSSEIKRAIANKELKVLYFPLVSLENGTILGFESLVRWEHPDYGLLIPHDFLQSKESKKLLDEIDYYILNESCSFIKKLQTIHNRKLYICINISNEYLISTDFFQKIKSSISNHKIAPDTLKLEITEQLLIQKNSEINSLIKKLLDIEVKVYLDDFGSGFSTLASLKNTPLEAIKIDNNLINNIFSNVPTKLMVKSIINLAKELNIEVIAEGIETEEHLIYLKDNEVSMGQGFFFSEPLEEKDAENFITSTPDWLVKQWKKSIKKSSNQLEIKIKSEGDLAVIHLSGMLRYNGIGSFKEKTNKIDRIKKINKVIIDFEKIDFISISGVREIFELGLRLKKAGKIMALCHLTNSIINNITILGATEKFKIYQTLNKAKSCLKKL